MWLALLVEKRGVTDKLTTTLESNREYSGHCLDMRIDVRKNIALARVKKHRLYRSFSVRERRDRFTGTLMVEMRENVGWPRVWEG